MKTFFWKKTNNFGDMLTPIILKYLGYTPEWVDWDYKGKLLAVGSILNMALKEDDVVWGSGILLGLPYERIEHPPEGVRFLSVRGPKTRNMINADVPEIYGDPALLLPRFYQPKIEKKFKIGLIPHANDKKLMRSDDPCICNCDINEDAFKIINLINSCEHIISSSLHGIIVAEAYGIPVTWAKVENDLFYGGTFKFNDYFLGTGREEMEPVEWNNKPRELNHTTQPLKSNNSDKLIEILSSYFAC